MEVSGKLWQSRNSNVGIKCHVSKGVEGLEWMGGRSTLKSKNHFDLSNPKAGFKKLDSSLRTEDLGLRSLGSASIKM